MDIIRVGASILDSDEDNGAWSNIATMMLAITANHELI